MHAAFEQLRRYRNGREETREAGLREGEAFWNEVDKVLPDYGERKEWLRRNGAGLDL